MSSRSTVMVKKGVVSSSHELASFWGANTLLKGGNVVDAAIVTSSVLCVVQNNMCGLGGDLFALIKKSGTILGLNGSGRAAKKATIDFYIGRGMREIPSRGPLAPLTVPGIVRSWGELLKHTSRELKELLEPAIYYAENGFPLTEKYVRSIRASEPFLGSYKGWRSIFMQDNSLPEAGFVLKQKDLANTLKTISASGTDSFYDGELSERLVNGIREQGGLLEDEDLRRHRSDWVNPISTDYRGVRIYETSPNSQGATVLLWLNMLESYDLQSNSPVKVTEVIVETCLKAYEERAKAIADPEFYPFDGRFVSKSFAREILQSSLTMTGAISSKAIGGDTTYFSVADCEGNGASIIQSNYMGFGSGLVPKGTGIVLHNRGCYFSLDAKHHNSLAPGKRPFHTLCASFSESDGKSLFALGSMGGDIQPQIHVQLMTKIIDFRIDLQTAIDAPRWIIPATIYEKPAEFCYEEGFPSEAIYRGKLATKNLGSFSSLTGHAQAVYFLKDGLMAASDPRGDGAAVGF